MSEMRRQGGQLAEEIGRDDVRLRHQVLNDFQTIIASIMAETARTTEPQVRDALKRVADCVYGLASHHRQIEH